MSNKKYNEILWKIVSSPSFQKYAQEQYEQFQQEKIEDMKRLMTSTLHDTTPPDGIYRQLAKILRRKQ